MHPHLIQFGHVVLPTYGSLVALGVILALLLALRSARLLLLDPDKIWNLGLMAIVTGLVGSRILLVLVNWPRYGLRAFSISLTGRQTGGAAEIVIAAVAAFAYASWLRLPLRRAADAMAPSLALAASFISIGCLEAGCAYGTPSRLPWAVIFRSPDVPPGTPLGVPLHPTQLYAALVQFALLILLLWMLPRPHRDGDILGTWLFLAGISNFLLSFLRGDHGPSVMGVVAVSQLIAAAMVLAAALLWWHRSPVEQVVHVR